MEFVLPSVNKFGLYCIDEIGEVIKKHSVDKVLIITTPGLIELGLLDRLIKSLNNKSVDYEIYDGVSPNPNIENVEKGKELYIDKKCNGIVGVGGGSANDCAKAIGISVNNNGSIKKYVGFNKSVNNSPLLICVNTTAGTASEISRAFLISDEEEKLIFKDIHALPDYSFNDPSMMLKLPKSITGQTGMDALTHAIESYVSRGAYQLTREFSISSIKLVFKNLEEVIENPESIEYRNNMIYAQSLAGMAFANSGLGLVHAMAHQLGAVYNLPHGLCNAVLLPYVMEYNNSVCKKEYAEISRQVFEIEMSDEEASSFLIENVRQLSENIGTYIKLRDMGVKKEDLILLSKKSLLDGNLPKNPIDPTLEDVIGIFQRAW